MNKLTLLTDGSNITTLQSKRPSQDGLKPVSVFKSNH